MTDYKPSQQHNTKPCPCGREGCKVYTDPHMRPYNSKNFEGKEACEECAIDALYLRIAARKKESA